MKKNQRFLLWGFLIAINGLLTWNLYCNNGLLTKDTLWLLIIISAFLVILVIGPNKIKNDLRPYAIVSSAGEVLHSTFDGHDFSVEKSNAGDDQSSKDEFDTSYFIY